ncbi:MAG: hypothetical protein M1824_002731 [Vezdaea acicularis]|nr:MAG: hypothetical protein M1824_002731 [Vezdaea acicularis]
MAEPATIEPSDSAPPSRPSSPCSVSATTADDDIEITVHRQSEPHTYLFPPSSTLTDLLSTLINDLSISPTSLKLLITPKLGMVRPPLSPSHAALPLTSLTSKRIVALGSTASQLDNMNAIIAENMDRAARRRGRRANPSHRPSRHIDSRRLHDEALYTFSTLRPLPNLPHPDRSLAFLARLRDDPGIKSVMRAHRFAVPLLTEMDPAAHTTHEGRTLGLNRNRGEVIELRLRTDAGDGYRDYKTIRRTLCHELAHNVWGEHDARFWKLCREIEKEVEGADWKGARGRMVGGDGLEVGPVGPEDEDDEEWHDGGGWTGGEFVLGGGGSGSGPATAAVAGQGVVGGQQAEGSVSRREVLARAAEERLRRMRDAQGGKEMGKRGDASGA